MISTLFFACIVFFVCCVQVNNGYPSGAPAESCSTLTPNHGDHQPQTSPIPYMIDISEFRDATNDCYYYTPGETYNSKECTCIISYSLITIMHV